MSHDIIGFYDIQSRGDACKRFNYAAGRRLHACACARGLVLYYIYPTGDVINLINEDRSCVYITIILLSRTSAFTERSTKFHFGPFILVIILSYRIILFFFFFFQDLTRSRIIVTIFYPYSVYRKHLIILSICVVKPVFEKGTLIYRFYIFDTVLVSLLCYDICAIFFFF